jgi:hypothetical protein
LKGQKMKCAECRKDFKTGEGAYVIRDGKPTPVSFCCYKHYLKYWSNIKGFEYLPEHKGGKDDNKSRCKC